MNKVLFSVLILVGTIFAVIGLLTFFIVIDVRSKYSGHVISGEAGEFASAVFTVAFISLSISGAVFYLVYRRKRNR